MKKPYIIIIFLCLAMLLASCNTISSSNSKEKANKETTKITHTYEMKEKTQDHTEGKVKKETIDVPINPKKVVVMDYGALDIMQQLKLQDHIVAITKGENASFLPKSLKEFKSEKYENLGNPGRPNYDSLAKAKPDVIFASFRQAHTKTLNEMKKAAPNAKIVFMSPNHKDYITSIKQSSKNIGAIFEKEKEAQELVEKLDAKVKESKEVINNKRVLFLNVDDKGIKSYGASGRFDGFLNQDLGIQHADTKIKPNSSGILISNEYLEKMNPDKLFVINRTQDENDDSIPNALKNPVINNAKAIENNDVYVFEANTWFFGEGGINLTMQQLNQIQQAYQ